MSFLNGFFLIALPLAAAPIILHLMRRRQRQVVSWGAMQFLTDAVGKGRRFDRLEEYLLLALRAAALLALVLALARPLVRGLSSQPTAAEEVVVVVDDSLSTDLRAGADSVYDSIRRRATEFIRDRSGGESVRVLMAADGPRWLLDQPVLATSDGTQRLTAALGETCATRGAANFLSCLRLAAGYDAADEKLDRRVVVFTDGQSKGWQVDARAVWARLHSAADQSQRKVSFEVVTVDGPASPGANLSIDRVTASRQVAGKGETIVFTAKVTNTSGTQSPRVTINWSVDGKRESSSDVHPLAAEESRTVEWRGSFDKLGARDVVAEITTTDALPLDNEMGVVVDVVDTVPVLVLAETADLATPENTFFATALGYDESKSAGADEAERWKSLFRPKFVASASAEKETFSQYQAVVINGLGELNPAVFGKLEEYVRGGGGLWIMLGARIDRDEFNQRWYHGGAGLCPISLGALARPEDPESPEAMIHPPSADHPATVTLSDTARLDIDKVRFQRYYTFTRQPGQEVAALLESGRGAPLALWHQLGKGRVIVQAYPLRTDWSGLPISKSFVVVMQDWLAYLTQPAATRLNLATGEPFMLELTGGAREEEADVTPPNGVLTKIAPVDHGATRAYRYAQTAIPGRYELRLAERRVPFRVARDAAESNLAMLKEDEIAMLKEVAGIRFGASPTTVQPVEEGPARLAPAWWPLLIMMVCLMAAESLFAMRVSRSRYGVMPVTSTT